MAASAPPAASAVSRSRSQRLRPPAPLAILLVLVAITGVAWAFVSPAWQAPDEEVHFAYVQTLAEQGRLPGGEGKVVASDLRQAISASNASATIFFFYAHPDWTRTGYERWQRRQASLPSDDGGGPNRAASYPPTYYASMVLPYLAASGGDIFTRTYAVRLGSVGWLLVTTLAVWLLAGELFSRKRLHQVVATASVGLWPMVDFVSSSVNPDGMIYALWTLVLWRVAVIAHRGLDLRRSLVLGGLTGLALAVKITSVALLPGVLICLGWSAWRSVSSGEEQNRVIAAAIAAAGAVLTLLPAAAGSAVRGAGASTTGQIAGAGGGGDVVVREFFSYLWQFYLPRLPFMEPVEHHVAVVSSLPVLNTWVGMNWGVFGWVNVWFAPKLYLLAFAITGLIAVTCLVRLVRRWRCRRAVPLPQGRGPLIALLGVVALTLLAALHWTDYGIYASNAGYFAQGRYLLPLAGLAGVAVAYAIGAVPARRRPLVAGAWLGSLVVLQLASLSLVAVRFYA